MVLFTILAIAVVVALTLAIFIVGTLGGTFLFVFGDVIVCIAIIVLIIKLFCDHKKKN